MAHSMNACSCFFENKRITYDALFMDSFESIWGFRALSIRYNCQVTIIMLSVLRGLTDATHWSIIWIFMKPNDSEIKTTLDYIGAVRYIQFLFTFPSKCLISKLIIFFPDNKIFCTLICMHAFYCHLTIHLSISSQVQFM